MLTIFFCQITCRITRAEAIRSQISETKKKLLETERGVTGTALKKGKMGLNSLRSGLHALDVLCL